MSTESTGDTNTLIDKAIADALNATAGNERSGEVRHSTGGATAQPLAVHDMFRGFLTDRLEMIDAERRTKKLLEKHQKSPTEDSEPDSSDDKKASSKTDESSHKHKHKHKKHKSKSKKSKKDKREGEEKESEDDRKEEKPPCTNYKLEAASMLNLLPSETHKQIQQNTDVRAVPSDVRKDKCNAIKTDNKSEISSGEKDCGNKAADLKSLGEYPASKSKSAEKRSYDKSNDNRKRNDKKSGRDRDEGRSREKEHDDEQRKIRRESKDRNAAPRDDRNSRDKHSSRSQSKLSDSGRKRKERRSSSSENRRHRGRDKHSSRSQSKLSDSGRKKKKVPTATLR